MDKEKDKWNFHCWTKTNSVVKKLLKKIIIILKSGTSILTTGKSAPQGAKFHNEGVDHLIWAMPKFRLILCVCSLTILTILGKAHIKKHPYLGRCPK